MSEPQNPGFKKNLPLDMDKWRVIIADWEPNKENQKKYCERLGLNLNTFTYARAKLTQSKKIKPKFIPITLSRTDAQNPLVTDIVILENPQGFKLHVSSGLPLDRLAKLFNLCGW